MKTINKTILLVGLLAAICFSGCKKDTPLTETEQRLVELKNSGKGWILAGPSGSVIKDGYDVTSQFTGFKLNFGDYTYTTQNSLTLVWEPSGTWQYLNNDPNKIERGDGYILDLTISTNTLDISFVGPGSTGGRLDGVSGSYLFHLVSE